MASFKINLSAREQCPQEKHWGAIESDTINMYTNKVEFRTTCDAFDFNTYVAMQCPCLQRKEGFRCTPKRSVQCNVRVFDDSRKLRLGLRWTSTSSLQ